MIRFVVVMTFAVLLSGCDHLSIIHEMRGYAPLSPGGTNGGVLARITLGEFNFTGIPPRLTLNNTSIAAVSLSDIKLSLVDQTGKCIYTETSWRETGRCLSDEAKELSRVDVVCEIQPGGSVSIVPKQPMQLPGRTLLAVFKDTSCCKLTLSCQYDSSKNNEWNTLELMCKDMGDEWRTAGYTGALDFCGGEAYDCEARGSKKITTVNCRSNSCTRSESRGTYEEKRPGSSSRTCTR